MHSFLTLRSKNMAAFLCIALITAIVGATGFIGMKKLNAKFNEVIESAPLIESAANMKLAVSQDLMSVFKLMAALDTDELDIAFKEHESFSKRFSMYQNAVLNGMTSGSVKVYPAKDEKLRSIVTSSGKLHQNDFVPRFKTI